MLVVTPPIQTAATLWRVVRVAVAAAIVWVVAHPLRADSTNRQTTVDQEAQAFVQDILAQRPANEFRVAGILHLRASNGRRTQIPVRYQVRLGETEWQSIYRTESTGPVGSEELVVVHRPDRPNEYRFTQISVDGSRTNALTLTNGTAGVSLAGSDFWLSDFGLEFLHWPEQRFIRDAKITMRWGRPMKVIESTNPRPAVGTYARVISWIDSELGSVVKADAYGTDGKRLKAFDLKSFKKVNGRWQVKDMEIRNDKTDTRTRLEFTFETP